MINIVSIIKKHNTGEFDILLNLAPLVGHKIDADLSQDQCRPTVLVLASVNPDSGLKRLNPRWKRAFMGHACDFVEIDPTCIKRENLHDIVQDIDGILLTGGDINVPPQYFGQEATTGEQNRLWDGNIPNYPFYDERFQIARYLTDYSKRFKVPLLAVCLGAQEVNVSLGGGLQQRIEGHLTHHADCDERWDAPYHDIIVERGGLLAEAFGQSGRVPENSIHKEGILLDDLSDQLRVEAMAEDGMVVEAFSMPGHPFFLGTQFHVESTKPFPGNEDIFTTFTLKSREHMGQRLKGYLQSISMVRDEEFDIAAE